MLREVFHVVAALQFSYGVYYDWNYVKVPSSVSNIGNSYGGKLRFLTVWDAIVQCIFFWICFVNDIRGSNEVKPNETPLIRKIKDHLFCSIAFPVAAFVSITFWGLYAIDRELIFPAAMDEFFPSWLNHVMHTNILLFTALEFATTFREYPPKRVGHGTLTAFVTTYLIWVFVIYWQSDCWVYPVMDVLNWPLRILFFVAMLLLIEGIYAVQERLNAIVWSKEVALLGRKKASSQKKAK